ncbi:MAG: hypothetical protein QOC81_4434 [Thermoanaerobaculia bacterium]|jgi:hypothetical protein|nr:hypothetical protein [Thermoanaerobaculia bacterium]
MRKLAVLFLLIISASSLAAQDEGWRGRGSRRDRGDRYRYYADNSFELTPFAGYTWGGKVYSGQTSLFARDANVASSVNYGFNLGIPLQPNGMKLELMVDRQSTNFTTGDGGSLFDPTHRLGDLDITYLHAGILVPFGQSRGATPYFIGSAGVANLDPRTSGLSSSTRFSASGGIGVKIPIQSHAGFRGEIRGFYTSLPNDETCTLCNYVYNRDLFQGQANFGIYFKF